MQRANGNIKKYAVIPFLFELKDEMIHEPHTHAQPTKMHQMIIFEMIVYVHCISI